ncbi:tripartite motif-containing protein 66 [Pygocentrus nattereri]|uniref:Tripartite motif containing 66 n=1 Tax=Pygocentrus nattereri TaxID=42514 RepID=A0A3B4CGV1_PYGNA|nr:tripartite motif-containing protein 66 [Pygocentrus nattereri]XP_017556127.1 tripartite motif-containing protein 66 [Pygocentrus nattereri]XP_017556128.1 tripartite motif-containing protein 66 [Pygocentrus nattereri]
MEKCCSECPEPRVAQSLCTFCNKWLCFQCTDLHQHDRASAQASESRLHQTASSPPVPSETGSACCGHAVVMCPIHKQEPLELFCETCDLMACSICHLSSHKDHRLVHVNKALQDQRWLLENLMARVEEKRSAVENTAKQIQGRLHGVKITQRKTENQIKMAKMIMMNELNKRANLLIEQLESISSGFKQRLEDQLQGAIELCSQLEHIQNFITWAVAHHRRNPLLFSKELIALQMQQLLEPLIHSEAWAPLKIKFNWDASFWTKQISTLGQLSVEGGSRSYSEGMGRPSILRPQPVACMAMSSLCHSVREPDCAYQAFCQPQLCCLHCRPAQSVQLEKYPAPLDKYAVQCPQQPRCISPTRLQRRWEPESTALQPQSMVHSSQRPTSSPVPEPIQLSPGRAPLQQPSRSNHQPQNEQLSAITDQAAASNRASTFGQSPHSQEQVSTDLETILHKQLQQDQPTAQPSTESNPTPAPEQQSLTNCQDEDRSSPGLDVHMLAGGCAADAQIQASPEMRTRSSSVPAELSSPCDGPSDSRPTGDAHCLATVTREQRCTAQQTDCAQPKARRPRSDSRVVQVHLHNSNSSSLTTYKTEPDNVYAYAYENTGLKSRTKCRMSREVQETSSREAPEGSKVPVVCLERLKILVSKCPPQGHQKIGSPTDSSLKSEGAASQELQKELPTEEVSSGEPVDGAEDGVLRRQPPQAENVQCSTSPGMSELQVQELCNQDKDKECTEADTPPIQSSDAEPSSQPESEEEHTSDRNLSEPRSVPLSDSHLESTTEAEFASEAEVESELQVESDLSIESEQQVESDLEPQVESDLESVQPPDLELSVDSEPELESEPDSTAEVTLNLEQDCEWEAEHQVATDSNAGSDVATVDQGAEEAIEMENEDFCAVCLIGGDLLCCDRCPKVFHLACHVPSLLSFPTGDWVCTLCRDVQQPEVNYDCEDVRLPTALVPSGLSAYDQRKCEKLTLLIYSNILSAPFHEPVSPLARHYYQIIKRPMDLSVIRSRLNKSSLSHYNSPSEFVADILLMFKNCAKFNYPDSEVAQAGHSLQAFFCSKLSEVFPELSCAAPEDDSDSDEYEEAERTAAAGFPWPERREQSHRKRKRRHSLNWRRHHY